MSDLLCDEGTGLSIRDEIKIRIREMWIDLNNPGVCDSGALDKLVNVMQQRIEDAQKQQVVDIVKFMQNFDCDAEIIEQQFL